MSHEPDSNLTAKEWSVRIFISKRDGSTHAEARLDTGAGTDLTGTGSARLSPKDQDVPEIGDELAVGRALTSLATLLPEIAVDDVEEAAGRHRGALRDTAWSELQPSRGLGRVDAGNSALVRGTGRTHHAAMDTGEGFEDARTSREARNPRIGDPGRPEALSRRADLSGRRPRGARSTFHTQARRGGA